MWGLRFAVALVVMPTLFAAATRPDARAAAQRVAPGLTLPAFTPPQDGAWFGATVSVSSPQTPASYLSLEHAAARGLDIDRDYSTFDTAQPSLQVRWDVRHHVIPLLSIDPKSRTGGLLPWSAVASGAYDSVIKAQAAGLASLQSPVLLSFDHEPELHAASGTPAEFVAAWRHYVEVFRNQGATNVRFVLILLAGTYKKASVTEWYPGDDFVDWVGADGYNSLGCFHGTPGTWRDFSTIFSGFNAFAVAHNKPAAVAEWGSVEDPTTPGRKAAWISAAATTIESWPQIKVASYFDGAGQSSACDWPLTSSSAAMTAYKAMSGLPYFNPRPTASVTATPSSGPAPLAVTFDGSGSTGALNPISSWAVDFGDGSPAASGTGSPPSAVLHTYAKGSYTATLEVADATGQYEVQSVAVTADPPPTVATGFISTLSGRGVTLAGWVDPNGLDTTCHFQWGTTAAFGSRSAAVDVGPGSGRLKVSVNVSGLEPDTVYFWRLVASNAAGPAAGRTKSFKTLGRTPIVWGVGATLTSATTAKLSGFVNPHQLRTTWYFQFGRTTAYGTTAPVPAGKLAPGRIAVGVSVEIPSLVPGGAYHYRLVAVNAAGKAVSTDHRLRVS